MQYDDIKHAYTESVVPVTEEDYKSREKYANMDDYRRARASNLMKARTEADHGARMKEKIYNEDSDNISRAYDLAKADEESRRQRIALASNLLKITNNAR